MITLAEIEAAADALPPQDKQQLLLFIAASLRGAGQLPPPRDFSERQISEWIAADEADMNAIRRTS